MLNLLHPYHFTVAQTRPSFGVEIHLQPKQKCLFSLSRRFISTPRLSLEKFKWATDAQSWTDKTLHCFEEVLAFPHILHPTIKLPGTDSSFSAQYLAIWHNKKNSCKRVKEQGIEETRKKSQFLHVAPHEFCYCQVQITAQIFTGKGKFQIILQFASSRMDHIHIGTW